MMFAKLRIKIFNWFTAGKLTLSIDNKPEYTTMSTYIGGSTGHNILAGTQYNFNPPGQQMNLGIPTINFNVAKANGGWIVQVNPQQTYNTVSIAGISDVKPADLYLIHDDEDFDSALGRIVTTSCLKA